MFIEDARQIQDIIRKDTGFNGVASSDLDAAALRLADASTLDDFILEAMRTLALAGNGHSRAIANAVVRTSAMRFVWLADGPCLVDGPDAGARLLAVNGVAVVEIFATLRPYLAGTNQRARSLAGFMLAWAPAISMATGVKDVAVYRLVSIEGKTFDLTARDTVAAEFVYPVRERGAADTFIARAGIASLEEAQRGTFHRELPGHVRYIRIADLSADLPDTIAGKLAAIATEIRGTRRLVVDLRGNPGGNFFGAADFARVLPEVAPGAALAVLVDKFTFSAGLVTAALLKFHAGGRLVGEEMGDAGAFHAEGGTEVLPQSGVSIRYSDGWHDWDKGQADPILTPPEIADKMVAAGSLIPEVAAAPTGADVFASRDVALGAALALVRK